MPDYKVPVNDYLFLFNDVLDMQSQYKNVQGGDEASNDMVEAIFTEAAKFCENELAPIYQSGDDGCTWDDGVVTTPAGFKEAYQKFIEAGWTSLTGSTDMGGQGLPSSIGIAINEMMTTPTGPGLCTPVSVKALLRRLKPAVPSSRRRIIWSS